MPVFLYGDHWTDDLPDIAFPQSQFAPVWPHQSASARRRDRRRALQAHPQAESRSPESPDDTVSSTEIPAWNCEELTAGLDAGGEDLAAALEQILGSVVQMSLDVGGCWVVQRALAVADQGTRAIIVAELHGHVREAIESKHANHILLKVVEVMPAPHPKFIIEELFGDGARYARHRFGCRVFCHLLQHFGRSAALATLLAEVLKEAGGLARHTYGHHVVQATLEHGPDEARRLIAIELKKDVPGFARHRHGSHCVESVLRHGSREDQSAITNSLLREEGGVAALAQSIWGAYVVAEILRLPGEASGEARRQLQIAAGYVRETKSWVRLLREFDLLPATAAAPAAAAA